MANTFMTKMLVFLEFLLQLTSHPGRTPAELWGGLYHADMCEVHMEGEALRSQWPRMGGEKLEPGVGWAGRLELSSG